MNCPAAPYHEWAVIQEVKAICAEQGFRCVADKYGNLKVSLPFRPRGRVLALAAHMDHPGFEVTRRLDRTKWLARFHGGVGDSYFRPRVPLRLMPGDLAAVLGRRVSKGRVFQLRASKAQSLRSPRPVRDDEPNFAVWELPDFEVRNGQIHGRSCDDLIGVATVLATLMELRRKRSAANVIGLISRAEEVGFQGALTLAAGKQIPKNAIIVSLETSKEIPPVKMGSGVIVRVGDRTSVFDSEATRYLTEVAGALGKSGLKFQRALMSGGTCEATAYQEFGFSTCAVCVALGNYHNCAANDEIRAEYVSIEDALSMVELLVQAARQLPAFDKITGKLPQRLHKYLKEAKGRLTSRETQRNK